MDRKYRLAVTIFMIFFLIEYVAPIWNSVQLADSLGWTIEEALTHRQVLKHVLRLPIYGLLYGWIWWSIPRRSVAALWTWRFAAWGHLIFKPLTVITLLYFANKAGVLSGGLTLYLNVLWTVAIVVVYAYTIAMVEKYWAGLQQK